MINARYVKTWRVFLFLGGVANRDLSRSRSDMTVLIWHAAARLCGLLRASNPPRGGHVF
jgi:hypothetical protein